MKKTKKDSKPVRQPLTPPQPRPRTLRATTRPVLRFSPTAWAKLLFFRDHGGTEVGGFGVTLADDLLFVEDFATVKQHVSLASVEFDDEAVADFFETQVDAGRRPEQFARIWLHTHPGASAQPSLTDEETFERVFGSCDWAVMFVLAKSGQTYARLRFNVGPGGEAIIPVEVDYSYPFGPSDQESWEAEYKANIKACSAGPPVRHLFEDENELDVRDLCIPDEWVEDFEAMEPAERQFIIDELAARPDLWEETDGDI